MDGRVIHVLEHADDFAGLSVVVSGERRLQERRHRAALLVIQEDRSSTKRFLQIVVQLLHDRLLRHEHGLRALRRILRHEQFGVAVAGDLPVHSGSLRSRLPCRIQQKFKLRRTAS